MKIIVNKKDIEEFDNSEVGKYKNAHLKRAKIMGIILIMFGLIWILIDLLNEINQIFDYITSTISILFGIYFIINTNIIKKKEVNKYIHDKKSSK